MTAPILRGGQGRDAEDGGQSGLVAGVVVILWTAVLLVVGVAGAVSWFAKGGLP